MSSKFAWFCVVLLICFPRFQAYAQIANATIRGEVQDASNAAVPNARITIINEATGLRRVVRSNGVGIYIAPDLPIGQYQVNAEVAGFKKSIHDHIQCDVGAVVRVDFVLQVGQTSQSITVQGAQPVVDTETTSVGNLRYGQQIQMMPLNYRGISALYTMTAGVPVYGSGVNPEVGGFVDVRGIGGTAYLTDGTVANSPINGNSGDVPALDGRVIEQNTPNLESIAEFKFITANGNAEYGEPTTISVVTKSGTNELHGSLFEYNRVGATSARSFFPPVRESLTRNQYGVSLGGPFYLPHIYDGRNRTFFFGAFEGFRDYRQFPVTGKFPNSAERNGDLSELSSVIRLRDPNGGFFPNDIIPPSRLSPVAKAMLAYVPIPAGNQAAFSSTAFNFVGEKPEVDWTNKFDARIDHQASDKDSISGRLTYSDSFNNFANASPLPNPIGLGLQRTTARQLSLSETHIVNPTNLNEFRLGFWRKHRLVTVGLSNMTFLTGDHAIPGINPAPPFAGLPSVELNDSVTGVTPSLFSSSTADRLAGENTFQASDDYTLVHGRHTFKFGADIRRQQINNNSATSPAGDFVFGSSTSPANSATGDAFADFLLGLPQSDSWQTVNSADTRAWQTFLFAQDDFKVAARLMLNYGLRWDYFGRLAEKDGRDANFLLSLGKVAVPPNGARFFLPQFVNNPLIVDANTAGLGSSLLKPDVDDFGPRIGLAYQPFAGGKTVFRLAYGIYYWPYSGFLNFQDGTLPPYNLAFSYNRPVAVGAGGTPPSFSDPVATGGASSNLLAAVNSVDPNYRDLYSQVWNFTIEHELRNNLTLRASYIGNKGTELPRQVLANACLPGPIPCQARKPGQNPSIDPLFPVAGGGWQTVGNSIYHAFQVEMEKRYSNGFFLNANYTFGRLIDDASVQPEDPIGNASLDRGLDPTSITSIFHLNAIRDLPFGPNRRFLGNATGALAKVVAGWEIAGFLTAQSGQPFSVTAPAGNTGTGSTVNRANCIGNADLPGNRSLSQKLTEYFNTAAFQRPALGQVGTCGVGTLIGPGYFDTDLSLIKNTAISEQWNLQFRAEFFNIFNNPNFANPVASITSSAFGRVNDTMGFPREIQFGLRLQF